LRRHDPNLVDDVCVSSLSRLQFDCVPFLQIFQPPEKRVSVTRNADVSWLAKPGRSHNATHSVIESEGVCSVQDWHFEVDLRNLKNGKWYRGPSHDLFLMRLDHTIRRTLHSALRQAVYRFLMGGRGK
jgi:hypothetical protein